MVKAVGDNTRLLRDRQIGPDFTTAAAAALRCDAFCGLVDLVVVGGNHRSLERTNSSTMHPRQGLGSW